MKYTINKYNINGKFTLMVPGNCAEPLFFDSIEAAEEYAKNHGIDLDEVSIEEEYVKVK